MQVKERISLIIIFLLGISALAFSEENQGIKYSGNLYRDPLMSFLPVKQTKKKQIKVEVTPPKLNLQGIVWGNVSAKAIINGIVVGEGDKIAGAKIQEIKKEGISFTYKEKNFFLERSGRIREIETKQLRGIR